jgi:hypothetical protein
MKLFKWKFEIKLFCLHIFLSVSTYRYGYKRGEKKVEPVETEQTNLFITEMIDSNPV